MRLLHLTFSPRGEQSESTQLSQAIVDRLCSEHTISQIARRDWAQHAASSIDGAYAHALANAARSTDDIPSSESLAASEMLIRELENADRVVIGTPHAQLHRTRLSQDLDRSDRARQPQF